MTHGELVSSIKWLMNKHEQQRRSSTQRYKATIQAGPMLVFKDVGPVNTLAICQRNKAPCRDELEKAIAAVKEIAPSASILVPQEARRFRYKHMQEHEYYEARYIVWVNS